MTMTAWHHQSLGTAPGFSRAIEPPPGRLLLFSGQVSTDDHAKPVHIDDMFGQASRCLEKIKLLTEAAGGSMSDVALLRFYVTDMSLMGEVKRAREAYFTGPVFPAMTGLGVVGLADPSFLIEIEAVAVIP